MGRMNQNLINVQNDFVDNMKTMEGVLGAWNFGSVSHGRSDEYSDVDLIFLVEDIHFKETEKSIYEILSKICDEIVLCWHEGFNNKSIISNSYLLKKKERLLQLDVVLLNRHYITDSMCKIHYTNLSEKDILFDTENHVKKLSENCPHGKLWKDNVERLMATYLLYFHMTAKYLLRQDYFKLNHAMQMLYHTHVSLLLTVYDRIPWGGAESKLHFLPADKQEHLKKYDCTEHFSLNKEHLSQSMEWFEKDIQDWIEKSTLNLDTSAITKIKDDWDVCTLSVC